MKKIIALFIVAVMLTAMFAINSSAAVTLVNVAEGKTYVPTLGEGAAWRTDGHGDGENGVNQKLTNGIKSTNDGGQTVEGENLVGAYVVNGTIEIVVDLGEVYTSLKKFAIDNFYFNWGINNPGVSVEYSVSDDNSTFTSVGIVLTADAIESDFTTEGVGWKKHDFILTLDEAVSGRYVKLTYVGAGYLWGSEIEIFNEEEEAPVTPSEEPTAETGDIGYVAFALIAVASLAAITVTKKAR